MEGTWKPVAEVAPHKPRFRRAVHGFPLVTSQKLRVVIEEAGTDGPPTLCEVRVYEERARGEGAFPGGER